MQLTPIGRCPHRPKKNCQQTIVNSLQIAVFSLLILLKMALIKHKSTYLFITLFYTRFSIDRCPHGPKKIIATSIMHLFHKRQGQMDTDCCYFYTETISGFRHLLHDDQMKLFVIGSWKYLVERKLVAIYGYVIMPNHIHLLWNMLQRNGKESAGSSFAKFTAHQYKKLLLATDLTELDRYVSGKTDRNYQFWKRDPLAIPVSSEEIFLQKLEYIHNNPVQEKWSLCQYPEQYRWSSSRFYSDGTDEFGILTHFRE